MKRGSGTRQELRARAEVRWGPRTGWEQNRNQEQGLDEDWWRQVRAGSDAVATETLCNCLDSPPQPLPGLSNGCEPIRRLHALGIPTGLPVGPDLSRLVRCCIHRESMKNKRRKYV
ncbi:hypothetical protein KIL84_000504 [Mauremys mutica]|uniref:Uncharacterized protein n=1 Tax=Mauremys mutica TaxID=74926 RepID=A0A9D3WWP4_9SAUR|nr:hypothetical protein KIL84_000504 [Mauremys mutica]